MGTSCFDHLAIRIQDGRKLSKYCSCRLLGIYVRYSPGTVAYGSMFTVDYAFIDSLLFR